MIVSTFQQEIIDAIRHMLQTMMLRDEDSKAKLLHLAEHSPEIFYYAIHDAYDMACSELTVLLDILERNLQKEESSRANKEG